MVKIEPLSAIVAANATDPAKGKELESIKQAADGDLSAREKGMDLDQVDELRALIKSEYETNSEKYAPNHYEEIMNPRSAFTCWRYISHKDGNVNEAFELMKDSLSWRKDNCVDDLDRSELIKEFWHFTPLALSGTSRDGLNKILYVLGKNYRKPHAKLKPFIPKYCGNILFSWDREHDLDLVKMHVIFDVTDTGYRNIDLEFMTWLITIKDFLPARWHQFSVIGIPFIVRPLVHLVLSWLPETYRRMTHLGSFDQLVMGAIDEDNLPVEVGGTGGESYKLAPLDAPWASELPMFSESDEMLKYVEYCIFMNDTKRAQMREFQMEHEKKLSKQNKSE